MLRFKNIIYVVILLYFSSCKNIKKEIVINDNVIQNNKVIFNNASDRSSAYVENSKIISFGEHTFLLILDRVNNQFKVKVVHLIDAKIVEERYIDNVLDNHGAGSIFFDSDHKICVIYGGHLEHLKFRCSEKSLNIDKFENYKYIDINKSNIYQTYPSVNFNIENNITYLVYREENIEKSIRNPKLVFIKLKNGVERYKKYVYISNAYYTDFTASIVHEGQKIYILFMIYGIKHDKITKFNKGIFLAKSSDEGKNFKIIPIKEFNESNISIYNYYNSNLVMCNKNLYFVLTNNIPFDKNIYLYEFNITNNQIIEYNLTSDIYKEIPKNIYKNVRISLSCNKKGELFFALPFRDINETQWNSLSNRVYFFKIQNYKPILIFRELNRSWLVNLEQNSVFIPSLLYNSPDNNFTIFRFFKEKE